MSKIASEAASSVVALLADTLPTRRTSQDARAMHRCTRLQLHIHTCAHSWCAWVWHAQTSLGVAVPHGAAGSMQKEEGKQKEDREKKHHEKEKVSSTRAGI